MNIAELTEINKMKEVLINEIKFLKEVKFKAHFEQEDIRRISLATENIAIVAKSIIQVLENEFL